MQIALVQFRDVGKKYYFSIPNFLQININDQVVVETIMGLEIGMVYNLKEENDKEVLKTLKPIIRIADDRDINNSNLNSLDEKEVLVKTKELVNEFDLDMKILDAEYTLDRSKLTIYFKSENRVDFRELVRSLSSVYQTRIELRQIGPRDVSKIVGGLGPCGLLLCCETFIGEFDAVTIKMAKNQNLSLNPKNISGICGKLLCCLKYEDEVYDELKQIMPDINDTVNTLKGKARVLDLNLISGKIKLRYLDEELTEWTTYKELV